MRALQDRLFREQIAYVYENNAYYHKRFDEIELKPQDIAGLDDADRVPMISKLDFRDTYL